MPAATSRNVLTASSSLVLERCMIDRLTAGRDASDNRRLVLLPSSLHREYLIGRLLERQPALLGVSLVTFQGLARTLAGREITVFGRPLERLLAAEAGGHVRTGRLPAPSGWRSTFRDLTEAGLDDYSAGLAIEAAREAPEGDLSLYARRRLMVTLDGYRRFLAVCRQVREKTGQETEAGLVLAATARLADNDRLAVRHYPQTEIHLYGFYDLTAVMLDFLLAVCRQLPFTLYLPWDPAAGLELSGPLLARFLGLPFTVHRRIAEEATAVEPPRAVRLPDHRSLAAWLAGEVAVEMRSGRRAAGPADIGVVTVEGGPLRPLLRQAFDLAGLSPDVTRRADDGASIFRNRLRLGVEMVRSDCAADAVSALAACEGGVAGIDPDLLPACLELLTALGVAYGNDWSAVAERLGEGRRVGSGRRDEPRGVMAAAARLTAEIGLFKAVIEQAERSDDPVALCRTVIRLASPAIDDPVARGVERVVLDDLATARRAGLAVGFAAALDLLAEAATGPTGSDSPIGLPVAVLDPSVARYRTFRRLFFADQNRGRFPRRPSEDPLLPDACRRFLRSACALEQMPVRGEAAAGEEFILRLLVRSAGQVTLACSRTDPEGRPVAPSEFLSMVSESTPPAVRSIEELTPDDVRLDLLGERLAMAGASAEDHAGCPEAGVPWQPAAPAVLWPSAMERYFVCPRRYYFSELLGLPEEDPGEPYEIDPAVAGSIVHRLIGRAFSGEGGDLGALAAGWLAEWRLLPGPVARAAADEMSALAGLAFEHELAFLDHLPAGQSDHRPGPLELCRSDLVFRAIPDRIDRCGGMVVLNDYKTGRRPRDWVGETTAGRFLQPLFYLALADDGAAVRARFVYLRSLTGGDGTGVIEATAADRPCIDHAGGARELLMLLASRMLEGLRDGRFPAAGSRPVCAACPYRLACPDDPDRDGDGVDG